ncbi:MAG TPA: plastocyanin/azurin family copper-binding protein [Actinomycetota bacterium]
MHARLRRILGAVTTLSLAFVLASPAHAANETIKGNNQKWHPKSVEISVGDKVTWKAIDTMHTVTAWKGDWTKNTTLSPGEKTSRTFNKKGTFRFRCTIHSSIVMGTCEGMCGKVKVT